VIRNNAISGNTGHGVHIVASGSYPANDNRIAGNILGADKSGTVFIYKEDPDELAQLSPGGNSENVQYLEQTHEAGVFIDGRSGEVTRNIVGGTTEAERNVISGNELGVRIEGVDARGNSLIGNYIGPDITGARPLHQLAMSNSWGNMFGGVAIINAPDNVIGGRTAAERNVISNNMADGVRILGPQATGNRIIGNYIGGDVTGERALANYLNGVWVEDAVGNFIGGVEPGAGNVIAYNGHPAESGLGVLVFSGTGNAILGNSIHHNLYGIQLGFQSREPNDKGDGDSGANNLQNFPEIRMVSQDEVSSLQAVLDSTPNTTFRIELFSNTLDSKPATLQGEKFVDAFEVTTDKDGIATFAVAGNVEGLTMTATDPEGNTSQFAPLAIVVNSTGDESDVPGDGVPDVDLSTDGLQVTLRAAIEFANSVRGNDVITFDIPNVSGTPVIRPASPLPLVTGPTIIDGSTQAGGRVELNGSNAGTNAYGLRFNNGDTVLKGLTVTGFQGVGLAFWNANAFAVVLDDGMRVTENDFSGVLHNRGLLIVTGHVDISDNGGWGIYSDATQVSALNSILVAGQLTVNNNGQAGTGDQGGIYTTLGLDMPEKDSDDNCIVVSGNHGDGIRDVSNAGVTARHPTITGNWGAGINAPNSLVASGDGAVSDNRGTGIVSGWAVTSNLDVSDNGGYGIEARGGTLYGVYLLDSRVNGNTSGGIRSALGVDMSKQTSGHSQINDNHGAGLEVLGGSLSVLKGIEILRNQGPGVRVSGGELLGGEVTASHNTGAGIVVQGGANANLEGTKFVVEHNSGDGINVSGDLTLTDSRSLDNGGIDLVVGGAANLTNVVYFDILGGGSPAPPAPGGADGESASDAPSATALPLASAASPAQTEAAGEGAAPATVPAATFLDRLLFTDMIFDPQGVGTIDTATDQVLVDRYLNVGLGSPVDAFDVNDAADIVVLNDLSYAFVTGYNWFLRYWPSRDPDHEPSGPLPIYRPEDVGSNVGIIRDPFGPNPELVTATQGFFLGFPEKLVLSQDESLLYVAFRGSRAVVTYDVRKMITRLETDPHPETFAMFPIDLADYGQPDPNIRLDEVGVGGVPIDLAVQRVITPFAQRLPDFAISGLTAIVAQLEQRDVSVSYTVTLTNPGLLANTAWAEELWLTDDGAVDGAGYEQKLTQGKYRTAAARTVTITMPTLGETDEPQLGRVSLGTIRKGLQLVAIVNAGNMIVDRTSQNNVVTAGVTFAAPDLVVSDLQRVPVAFGDKLAEVRYTVTNDSDVDIPSGTTWREQVWLGTGRDVFASSRPDEGSWVHQLAATTHGTPLAAHASVTRTLTPDLTGVTLPAGVNASDLNWIVLIDFPSDTAGGTADGGDVLESHELAPPPSGVVIGATVGSATRALRVNNVLMESVEAIDFAPLQFDVLSGEFVRNSTNGNLELLAGKARLGLKPQAGRSFTPLVEVTGDVIATLREVTIQGDVKLLVGAVRNLYRGTFTFPLGSRAGAVQETGGLPNDFTLGGLELMVSGLEFALPDTQFPDGQLLVTGTLTLPNDLGGVALELGGNEPIGFAPTGVTFGGTSGAVANHQFTLGGLDFEVPQFVVQYLPGAIPELRLDGTFRLPQFDVEVDLDVDSGNYFTLTEQAGLAFGGTIAIDFLPIDGGFNLIDTEIEIGQQGGNWQVTGTSTLGTPAGGGLDVTFDVQQNGQIDFHVLGAGGLGFQVFGLKADAAELTLVSDRTPGDPFPWDPQVIFSGTLALPTAVTGPASEIVRIAGPAPLVFPVTAAAPLVIDQDGVQLAGGELQVVGTYSLRLFNIAIVEISNPSLALNTDGRWAEFRTRVTFPQLADATFDFRGGRFVQLRDSGASVRSPVVIPGPINITDDGSFHLRDLKLVVAPSVAYRGAALLQLPDRVLDADVEITSAGTQLDVQTWGQADLALLGLPFDMTGAELVADCDPAADPAWDPELRLQGTLPLPAEFGGLVVDVDAANPLIMGRGGLGVESQGLALPPDRQFILLDQLELQTTADSRLVLDFGQDQARLLGAFVIPSLNDMPVALGSGNHATMQQTVAGHTYAVAVDAVVDHIPISGGFSVDDVRVHLSKTFMDSQAALSGSAQFVLPGGAAQIFGLAFADGRPAALQATAGGAFRSRLQGVDVTVAQFAFLPDRVAGDADAWDPQFTLTGSLGLPAGLGGQTLPLSSSDALVVNESGLTLSGGGVPVPDAFRLFESLDIAPADLRLSWLRNPEMWVLQGRMMLPGVFGAAASLTGTGRIEVTGGTAEPAQVDLAGAIQVSDIALEPGLFGLSGIELFRDADTGWLEGTAELATPPDLTLPATLQVRDGGLDRIGVDQVGLELPLGVTGTTLQAFQGAVVEGQTTTLSGTAGVTGGPQVAGTLPAFAGGQFAGSLFGFDGTANIDANRLAGNGQIQLAGGVGVGLGTVDLNWTAGTLTGTGTFDLLDGLVSLNGSFCTTADFDMSLGGPGRVTLPAIALSPLDGRTLDPALGQFEFSSDGDLSNDFVAGYGLVDTFLGPVTLGFRVWLDGRYDVIQSEVEIPTTTGGAGVGDAAQFAVPAGRGRLLLRTFWQNDASNVQLRVTRPDGTTLEEVDFAFDPDIEIIESLSNVRSRTVGIRNPAPGVYKLEFVSTAGLGQTRLRAYAGSVAPQLTITGPTTDTTATTVSFTAADAESNAHFALYVDNDQTGYDGIPVVRSLAETDASGTVTIDTTGLAAGAYHVYGIIDDGQNAPVRSNYSAGRILVAAPHGTIRGTVFDDLNANGVRDVNERGVAGRTVFIDGNGDGLPAGEPAVVTAADGSYSFTVAQGAVYQIAQVIPAGATATTGAARTVRIGVGENVANVNHGTVTFGQIAGTAFDDLNGSGAWNTGEPGLPGVAVFLDADGDGSLDAGERSTTTGGDGGYRFEQLAPGAYRVAQLPLAGIAPAAPQTVHLISGGDARVHLSNFVLGSVAGMVYLDSNSDGVRAPGEVGISGVVVFLDANGNGTVDRNERQTVSGAGGQYRFDGLAQGTYTIAHVAPDGFLSTAPRNPQAHVVHLLGSGTALTGRDFGDRPPGVVGGNFNVAAPAAQAQSASEGETPVAPPGFTTTGNVAFDGARAVLYEAEDLFSGLETTFSIPEGAVSLQFTLVSALLGDNGGGIPDAFEVSLRDPASGASLVPVAEGLSQTDALLSFQADGTVFFGANATVPGTATSGAAWSQQLPLVVSIDLSKLSAGTAATLRFDLLGFGEAGSSVAVDDVFLTQQSSLEPPLAGDDTATTGEDTAVLIDVLTTDRDPDGALDPATVQVIDGPQHGTTTVDPVTGKVTYTPARDFSGLDSFTYSVQDNAGQAASATVTITVVPANDAPVAADDAWSTWVNVPLAVDSPGVLGGDTDPDPGDTLTVTTADTSSALGASVVVRPDGGFTYDATASPTLVALAYGATMVDTFTYTIGDGHGGTDTGTVSITVTGVHRFPWQNAWFAYDVNNDKYVTPLDVLLVINYINVHGFGDLPVPPVPPDVPPPYVDVVGDNVGTPQDVVVVINYINRYGIGPIPGYVPGAKAARGPAVSGGEGESAAPRPSPLVAAQETNTGSVDREGSPRLRAAELPRPVEFVPDDVVRGGKLEDALADIAADVAQAWPAR
jgi:VCBS repeat-containing protein